MEISQLYSIYKSNPVITTDSRSCPPGSIFFALKGDNFDGNRFAVQALEQGCRLAVVDDIAVHAAYLAASGDPSRMVLTADVLQTFKDLAREHRRQFDIPVIGITGTNGKTTTKELVRAVLAERYRVMATEGNFNNDVGVPKTLFRLTAAHEIAIVEMGASHPGDIKTLAETAEPTCGLITNVGKAHLQGFGSLEGVLSTKGELYDYLASRDDSLIFVNAGNDLLRSILPQGVKTCCYSAGDGGEACRVTGKVITGGTFLRFTWSETGDDGNVHEVNTRLVGNYNIDNALAAIAVGRHFGVSPESINRALENYQPSNNRSQMIDTGANKLIVDAYNANPTSMEAALLNFKSLNARPKMAIIGEMRELGESSRQEHRHIAEVIASCHFEKVWVVGHEFDDIDGDFVRFADVESVKEALRGEKPSGFNILIKGSNGTKLFQLPELL